MFNQQSFQNSQNFGRTQGSGFGNNNRNTQGSTQFAQKNFNQSRVPIDGQFLNSQIGGLQPQRSQPDFNPNRSNNGNVRQNQRAFTPDNMQYNQFGNSSAQSGKQFQQPGYQTGYTQPFQVDGGQYRPPSNPSDMAYTSPDRFSQQFNLQQTRGGPQSSYDNRPNTQMNRTTQNMMASQNQQQDFYNQGFMGAEMPTEININTVRNNMASVIKDSEHRNDGNSFLKDFDAYEQRQFETWELMSMFKLSSQQVRALQKQTDPEFHQKCTLKALCQELRQGSVLIDYLGFSGSQSEYKDRFNRSALQAEFKKLAQFLLSAEFTPNGSNSYQEVFANILKFGKQGARSQLLDVAQLKDFLDKKCSKILNTVHQGKLVEYLLISRNSNRIVNVQFVHAMRQIYLDQKRWDLSGLFHYIKGVEEKTKAVIADPLIEKIRQHLYNKALYNEIESRMRTKLMLKLKLAPKEADLGEQSVAQMPELISFLDQLQSELKLTVKERETLINRYTVTPLNVPLPDRPALPPGADQQDKSKTSAQQLNSDSVDKSKLATQLLTQTLQQTASQQQLGHADSSKQLINQPSSESFARDTLNESKNNIPAFKDQLPNLNERPAFEPLEKDDEYEEIEDDGDFDNTRQPAVEQLEGGTKEQIQKWFSLQKFKAEMQPTQEMLDKALSQSRPLKFQVLQSMKGWAALTGDKITKAFKLNDKKGTLYANKRQLKSFLQKVLMPEPVSDLLLSSVLEFFGRVTDQGQVCIEYMQFYQFFYQYANINQIKEDDGRIRFLQELQYLNAQNQNQNQKGSQKENRSLGKLMGLTDFARTKKHLPIYVEAALFFQVYSKLLTNFNSTNKRGGQAQQAFPFEKEIKEILQVTSDNKINIVYYQEIMGFKLEDEPTFSATNALRQLCSSLQLGGISLQIMRQVVGKETQIQRFLQDLGNLLQSQGIFEGPVEQQQQIWFTLENLATSLSIGSQINSTKFLGKIEFEMHKLVTLEHFYIKLKAEMKANQQEQVGDVFIKYGADSAQREISRENLLNMLKHLNLIGEELQEEFQYYIDEYDSEDNKMISLKQFEDDYEEFVGSNDSHLETLSQKIIEMIFQFSQHWHNADLVKTINSALGNNPDLDYIASSWMQGYDFRRWFLSEIVEQHYQQFDHDLVELFVQFTTASDNSKQRMINVPNLLKKITDLHMEARTTKLVKQLADLSLRILQDRIVDEIQKRNQRPVDYFQGRQVTDHEFERMITSGPFNLNTLQLNSNLQEIAELFKRGSQNVNLEEFVHQLDSIFDLRVSKINLYKQIQHSLEERGQDIHIVLKMIKGQINSSTHLSLNEFCALISLAGVTNIDTETFVKPIFQKFEADTHGEVSTDAFLIDYDSAFKQKKKQVTFQIASKSLLSSAGAQSLQPSNKPIVARRNYQSLVQSLEGIARAIQEQELRDFGSFLKGYDFTNSEKIETQAFFKVMSQLFSEQVLGKGDILDLIQYLDPEESGQIDIHFVAVELNKMIYSPHFRVVLQSSVSEVIDQNYFDPLEEKEQGTVETPKFMHFVLLDLFCGLLVRKQSMLSEWLAMFSRQEEGFLSLTEMTASFDKLDVSATSKQKQALFNYFASVEKTIERDEEFKKTGFVPTSVILQIIETEFSASDMHSLTRQILEKVALYLHQNQIPILDCCAKLELTMGSGQISYVDFTHGLLRQELKLEKDITRNMIEVLSLYFNPEHSQVFQYEPFLQMLQQIAYNEGLKVFNTQEEKELFEQTQAEDFNGTLASVSQLKKVAPKQEPLLEVRSHKNTYFNGEKFTMTLADPSSYKLCDDIIIYTRQLGISAEKHFQSFGKFSQTDGLRRLDLREFRDALVVLKIEWANKTETVSGLYHQIEDIFGQQMLSLEMIGQILYFNSNVKLENEEAKVLEMVHKALFVNQMLDNVEEMLNFHNFNKDGNQTASDFQNMLLNHLRLKDKVSVNSICLLTQRYRINPKESKQMVFAFRFVEDLAYQHLNIGIQDQWATKLIESMIKQLQVKFVFEAGRQGMRDIDTSEELGSFFRRNCQQSREEIYFDDMYRSFAYLKLIDETDDRSKIKVDNFFKMCSVPSVTDFRTFKPNSINAAAIDLPLSIKIGHFLSALQVLSRKPLTCLYQEVFLRVFFSSKRRGVSIHGPDLQNIFIHDDISNSGQVPLSVFCEELRKKIIDPRSNISEQELLFLATKYIAASRGSESSIGYNQFLNDYQEADNNAVSGRLSLIFSPNDQAQQRALQARLQDRSADLQQLKTIENLAPEQRQIFEKMSKYLVSKDLDEILCMELVNRDQPREGFLSLAHIKASLKKIGIPVSQNQLQQLTHALMQNDSGSYSYLELISILFGARYMQRIQSENGLWSEKDKLKHKPGIDLSKLSISQRLIDQLELNLSTLNRIAAEMSQTLNLIRDQEFFTILKQAEVNFDSMDLEVLQAYLRERRDPSNHQVNLALLLKHFKVGEDTSALLYQIQQQLQGKDLNSLTSQPQITFIDFKAMLQRAGVPLPKTGNVLERLFKQISEQKQEVSRATILRTLATYNKKQETLQLPAPPAQVKALMSQLIAKQIDLKTQFTGIKEISVMKFDNFLQKNSLQTNSAINNFFKGTSGDLSLSKLIAYQNLILQNSKTFGSSPDQNQEQKFQNRVGQLPDDVRLILEKITSLIEKQRLETSKLFKLLDQNGSGLVDFAEFDAFCTKQNLAQGLTKSSVERLFKYLDSSSDGAISTNEFCMLIKGCQLTIEERMASAFTPEFEKELRSEIYLLFDKLDSDKNRWLIADELVIMFKNEEPHNSLSLDQAKQVIVDIDKDSNGKISREEFVNYIVPKQKKSLLEMEDQLQDLRDVFAGLVNSKSGFGAEQQLTTAQFKTFLQKAGLETIQDAESNDLFTQIDTNMSGTIDIDEMMKFVVSNENLVGKAGATLMNLRKKRAKLNSLDVFDLMRLLPPYMQPSFTQRLLEQSKEGRLSNRIQPTFDFSSLKFGELSKVKERTHMGNREFISINKPNFAMEFTITEIKGVPSLSQQLLLDESQTHLEVRYFIFDAIRKVFCSAVLSSHAKIAPQKQAKVNTPSNQWQVEDHMKTICLRSSENWHLVIELVAYDQRDKTRQITAGWTSCPVSTKPGKIKLPLRGGSPFNASPPEIVTSENIAKVNSGFLKLLSGNKPPVVERHIALEIQQFFKMDETLQGDISVLPENTICFKNLIGFVINYRAYCFQKLTKYETLMQKPKGDLIIAQFSKIYDSPDVHAALAEHWPKLSQIDPSKDKVAAMKTAIQRLYGLVHDSSFGFDHVYPTRSTTAEKLQKRLAALKQCLLQEKSASPPVPQKTISAITFSEDYLPFSLGELSVDLV